MPLVVQKFGGSSVGTVEKINKVAERVAARAKTGVNIQMITTSEIKVTCVISRDQTDLAVNVLHDCLQLDNPATERPAKKPASKPAKKGRPVRARA